MEDSCFAELALFFPSRQLGGSGPKAAFGRLPARDFPRRGTASNRNMRTRRRPSRLLCLRWTPARLFHQRDGREAGLYISRRSWISPWRGLTGLISFYRTTGVFLTGRRRSFLKEERPLRGPASFGWSTSGHIPPEGRSHRRFSRSGRSAPRFC